MKGQKASWGDNAQPQTRGDVPYPLSLIPPFFPLPPYPLPFSMPATQPN